MAAFLDVHHTSVKCLRSKSCLEAIFKLRLGRSQLSGGLWAIISGTEDGVHWSRKGWSGDQRPPQWAGTSHGEATRGGISAGQEPRKEGKSQVLFKVKLEDSKGL